MENNSIAVHSKYKLNEIQLWEGERMTDLKLLKEKIDSSGMTMVSIAKKSNILRETLYNRLGRKGEFTASEIVSLTETLDLTRCERDAISLNKKLN